MNIFRKIKAWLRLYWAVSKADRAHKETGERYYVMPMSGMKAKLLIMDRYNFRKLKQKRYVNGRVFVNDLERECFYCTPYRDGKSRLSKEYLRMKAAAYYRWFDSCYAEKKKR